MQRIFVRSPIFQSWIGKYLRITMIELKYNEEWKYRLLRDRFPITSIVFHDFSEDRYSGILWKFSSTKHSIEIFTLSNFNDAKVKPGVPHDLGQHLDGHAFDVSARGGVTLPPMGANRCNRHPVQGAEWDEREDYTVWSNTGRGILSIKDAFYLTSSSSPPVIHLPRSLPPLFPGTLPPRADHADTSQQPATSCYSKVISPDRCPSSFIPIDLPREQGTGELGRMSRDHEPSLSLRRFALFFSYRPRKTLARAIERTDSTIDVTKASKVYKDRCGKVSIDVAFLLFSLSCRWKSSMYVNSLSPRKLSDCKTRSKRENRKITIPSSKLPRTDGRCSKAKKDRIGQTQGSQTQARSLMMGCGNQF